MKKLVLVMAFVLSLGSYLHAENVAIGFGRVYVETDIIQDIPIQISLGSWTESWTSSFIVESGYEGNFSNILIENKNYIDRSEIGKNAGFYYGFQGFYTMLAANEIGGDNISTAGSAWGIGASIGNKALVGPFSLDTGVSVSQAFTIEQPELVGTKQFNMDGVGYGVTIAFGYEF